MVPIPGIELTSPTFWKINPGNYKRKLCGNKFYNIAAELSNEFSNQVFCGTSGISQADNNFNNSAIFWFPEFLTFNYDDSNWQMINLESELGNIWNGVDVGQNNNLKKILTDVPSDQHPEVLKALQDCYLNPREAESYLKGIDKNSPKEAWTDRGGEVLTDEDRKAKFSSSFKQITDMFKDHNKLDELHLYDLSIYNVDVLSVFLKSITSINDFTFQKGYINQHNYSNSILPSIYFRDSLQKYLSQGNYGISMGAFALLPGPLYNEAENTLDNYQIYILL